MQRTLFGVVVLFVVCGLKVCCCVLLGVATIVAGLIPRLLFIQNVRAHDADTLFHPTQTMEDQRCSLKGCSSHDEHPWMKTVQATLFDPSSCTQDVIGCARAKDSWSVPQFTRRDVLLLLPSWECARYRVSTRTHLTG